MNRKAVKCFIVLLFALTVHALESNGQHTCEPETQSFSNGESVTYKIQYHWGFIWLTAGEVTFTVKESTWNNQPCYYFKGIGSTYPNYDWFYKVRDTYEAWSDISTLKPFEFKRDVSEGNYKSINHYQFDYINNVVHAKGEVNGEPIKSTIDITSCLYDVLTLVYYSRCIDFNQHAIGELIPLDIILDGEAHHINVKCLGEETIKHNDKEVSTLKFSSELVAGSIFKEGDELFVWVSNDKERVPIKIKAEILVGAIEANLAITTEETAE